MEKKYNFTYTIINTETGQYYIGKHSTNNIDDGYMGSGAWVKNIKDIEDNPNIVKIINEFYDTSEEAYRAEMDMIGSLWKNDPLCMNRMRGGVVSFFEKESYSRHCLEAYGTDHHMKSEEFKKTFRFPFKEKDVRDKADQTVINRYGGKGSGSKEIKSKVEKTNLERYGTTHTLNNDNVKAARESSSIKKYGTTNPFKNPEKLADVLEERYGYRNMMLDPEVKERHKKAMQDKDWTERNEKSKSTNLTRYGVTVAANQPHIREMHKRACPFSCKNKHKFDAGNFTNHMVKVHNWTKEQVKKYKDEN